MIPLKPALQESGGRSRPWSGARLLNAYAEVSDDQTEYAIMAIPGLDPFANFGAAQAPVRGVHVMAGLLYVVSGSTFARVAANGAITVLGVVGGMGPVTMADNGTQIAIAASDNIGRVFDGATVVSSPPNLPAVSSVCYIDGYFVWPIANGDQFIISGLNDGLTYDPLDVATVEGDPDAIVGVVNDHRELQFYGARTVEVWYNGGAADFPFERQGNAFLERGCIDGDSLVKVDNSVLFVGDDRIAYRLNGYTPQRISTHAIEYRIASATWFRAFTYTQEGHKFYVLNTDVGAFAYDVATGAWAERQSYGYDNYRVSCAIVAYGKQIAGDAYTGKLYVMSLDRFDEDGAPILPIVELPGLENKRERATLYAIELYCETGGATLAVPDPQVIMQYSRDGSRTWSNEMARSMGAIGEYNTRAVWRPNVQFRQVTIRFQMPSSVKRFVMGYWADVR